MSTSAEQLPPEAGGDPGPPPANTRLVQVGRGRVVVCNPNQKQFGHFGIEMLYAMAWARLVDAPVTFLRSPAPRVGHTLFEVEADDVRVVWSDPLARTARVASRLGSWWRDTISLPLTRDVAAELDKWVGRHRLPKPVRSELREAARARRRNAVTSVKAAPRGATYNRRRLLVRPVATRLRPNAQRRAETAARAAGIEADAPLVVVHVRERGFKLGYEMQDKNEGGWDDSVRNARIETHFAAIDELVARGHLVVRIGDASMTPVRRPGVVDLATAATQDPLLELYCLFRSRFILCGESGPYSVSFLTNTPLLAVNCTDPIGAYPVRPDGIYLLKSAIERTTGERVEGERLYARDRLTDLRNTVRYQLVENTTDEILDAAREMLDLLELGTPPTPEQEAYREAVTAAAIANGDLYYVRKHGPDDGYLGTGRLARAQARSWAEAGGRVTATV